MSNHCQKSCFNSTTRSMFESRGLYCCSGGSSSVKLPKPKVTRNYLVDINTKYMIRSKTQQCYEVIFLSQGKVIKHSKNLKNFVLFFLQIACNSKVCILLLLSLEFGVKQDEILFFWGCFSLLHVLNWYFLIIKSPLVLLFPRKIPSYFFIWNFCYIWNSRVVVKHV